MRPTVNPEAGVYDSKLEGPRISWVGPQIGETIELNRLRSIDNKNPKDEFEYDILIFLVINPGCPACQSSTDQMREVEHFASENAIGFSMASFRRDVSLVDLQVFRDFAGLSSRMFSFEGNESDISPTSNGLQYPSYISTDDDGKNLRIFAGSHQDDTLRKKLTEQIKGDTLRERESRIKQSTF